MLKLKLQYSGYLMWRTDSLEKTLMLGKMEGGRRRGWQRMRWLDSITSLMDMNLSMLRKWWNTGKPGVLQSHRESDTRATEQWTTYNSIAKNKLKWAKYLNRHFPKEGTQLTNRSMNRCSTSFIIKDMANQNLKELSPHLSEWPSSKWKEGRVSKDVEGRGPLCTVVGM